MLYLNIAMHKTKLLLLLISILSIPPLNPKLYAKEPDLTNSRAQAMLVALDRLEKTIFKACRSPRRDGLTVIPEMTILPVYLTGFK